MQIMKGMLKLIITALVFMPALNAQIVTVKGKGEVVYAGIFKQGAIEERQAIAEAKKSAVRRYAAGFDAARFENFKKNEPEILANIDELIIDYKQIDQEVDKTSKRFSVVIEASLNTSLIERMLRGSSAVNAPSSGKKSNIIFIFVAKELSSRKSFDAKRSDVSAQESSETSSEQVVSSEDGSSAKGSVEKAKIVKNTSGGSTEFKADALNYQISTVSEVDSAVSSVLSTAGYKIVKAAFAGVNVNQFKADFGNGKDVSDETLMTAVGILQAKKIPYLAIASMDIGIPEQDPVSGMTRVFVTVNAVVTFIPSDPTDLPSTAASIAGKPYSGLGSNPQVARTNALNEAATKSATELTDQLRMHEIK